MGKVEKLYKRITCLEEDNIQLRTDFFEILKDKGDEIRRLHAEVEKKSNLYAGIKALCEQQVMKIDQLRAENLELENNQACDVCSPDDYGWQHNAVEGRVPCVCITESGAYQEICAEVTYWQNQALGHIACEQHTETHVGEMVECPFCAADRLRVEKAELWQMLKSIVDTHRAGYSFLDMTKPQALLDRLDEKHDQIALWTIDQLRTALDNLTEVARLAQEAAATAETRAVTRCAEIVNFYHPNGQALEAIRKEYGL